MARKRNMLTPTLTLNHTRPLQDITQPRPAPSTVHNRRIAPVQPVNLVQPRPHRVTPVPRALQHAHDMVLRERRAKVLDAQ